MQVRKYILKKKWWSNLTKISGTDNKADQKIG